MKIPKTWTTPGSRNYNRQVILRGREPEPRGTGVTFHEGPTVGQKSGELRVELMSEESRESHPLFKVLGRTVKLIHIKSRVGGYKTRKDDVN